MTATDTYKARTARFLFEQGVFPPRWLAVDDVLDRIASASERQKAHRAVRKTALDDFSPVKYVEHTGEEAVSLVDAQTAQVEQEVIDWIEMWDESEMPPGLK